MQFNFEHTMGYFINKTAALMRNHLMKEFQREYPGITVDYWVILNRLWIEDGINQTSLARLTAKDNASITRILDGMQRKGLVERRQDPGDRRAYRIYLTEDGKLLEQPLKRIASAHLEKGRKNLSDQDLTQLKRILETIIKNY